MVLLISTSGHTLEMFCHVWLDLLAESIQRHTMERLGSPWISFLILILNELIALLRCMDSDLDVFSHIPIDDGFAALASQLFALPNIWTNCSSCTKVDYCYIFNFDCTLALNSLRGRCCLFLIPVWFPTRGHRMM